MAREFFSTLPDHNFMRMLRRGGRNEFLFTLLGIGFIHFGIIRGLKNQVKQPKVHTTSEYTRVKVLNY